MGTPECTGISTTISFGLSPLPFFKTMGTQLVVAAVYDRLKTLPYTNIWVFLSLSSTIYKMETKLYNVYSY